MQAKTLYPHGALRVCCWKCGFDLRTSLVTAVHDFDLESMQIQFESAMENGHTSWAGNQSMYSIVFFDGLRSLISGIVTKHTCERLVHSSHIDCSTLAGWPHAQFEMTTQRQRLEFFHVFAMIIKEWPTNFIRLIEDCKLRYADLKKDCAQGMYWYEEVIKSMASGGFAGISTEEANSIANAVITEHGRFSLGMARNLSGRDIADHVPDRKLKPISEDVYEDFLTSIDHQIAGTLDKTERACLIRDKVMFAVGRQLSLSQQRLADLTLDQVRQIVPDKVEVSFVDVARTPAQARAWAEWYCEKMRDELRPKADAASIFTSAKTGQGFKHSIVGLRFQKLAAAGNLQQSNVHYGAWLM